MTFTRIIATLLAAGACTHAQAQTAGYPSRPVRVIVPVAAGGNVDIIARGIELVASSSPDEFAAYIKSEAARYVKLSREANIKAE